MHVSEASASLSHSRMSPVKSLVDHSPKGNKAETHQPESHESRHSSQAMSKDGVMIHSLSNMTHDDSLKDSSHDGLYVAQTQSQLRSYYNARDHVNDEAIRSNQHLDQILNIGHRRDSVNKSSSDCEGEDEDDLSLCNLHLFEGDSSIARNYEDAVAHPNGQDYDLSSREPMQTGLGSRYTLSANPDTYYTTARADRESAYHPVCIEVHVYDPSFQVWQYMG